MSTTSYSLEVVDDINEKREEYEELLFRRDQLFRESGSILTAYTKEFGDMITANFGLKIECIKKKKTISYCRRRINRGLAIDTSHMQAEIDREMTLYYLQLEEMLDDTERAKKAEKISEFKLSRAKKIYRRLIKLLHPDTNKKIAENERIKELWKRITEAYQNSDADALDDLEVLACRAMKDIGDDGFDLNLDYIEARIERLENQINDILTTEPYIYNEILCDEEKKQAYKEQLRIENDDYTHYLESLTKTLDELLREGEVKLVWQMS